MQEKEVEVFYPANLTAWRIWLEKNHLEKKCVWVVFSNKASPQPSLSWRDAVMVALCFGWIDSKKVSVGKDKSHQFFSKRKARSTWSKINKDKIEKLIEAGLMTEAGFESIDVAKQNGSWTILDNVEQLIIPKDLAKAFKANKGSKEYFLSLSKSVRKMMLQWIELAKRPETRKKRVDEIAELAAKKLKPKQF